MTFSKVVKASLSGLALSLVFVGAQAGAQDKSGETFKLGLDLYRGVTNISGVTAQNNDGLWAGSGPAYPSVVSLNWANGEAQTAKVSFGIGDMYTKDGTQLKQPVEAFYKTESGKDVKVTVGKFWVPFGVQEWEYETKWGAQVDVTKGVYTFTAATTYNHITKQLNTYARVGRQCGAATSFGISGGYGKGFQYNSAHDSGFALDMSHQYKGFTLTSEYDASMKGSSRPFQFAFAKLAYNKLGIFTPYVSGYYWHDPIKSVSDPQHFSSAVLGLNIKLTKELALENAYTRSNGKYVWWSQAHISF